MTERSHPAGLLLTWVTWQERPFPDANLLLVRGRDAALVDSGFVGHAQDTADWARAQAPGLALVVNTHWHADHVGGNGLLQQYGVAIAASASDADAVNRRDPGCCLAEYLDQPVAPYTVDRGLSDGEVLRLGDTDWQVIATPGHTVGHIAFWQPDERILAVGDALSSSDVGWVNLAPDGPDATATALTSLERLIDLQPRVLLPAHGPVPADTAEALDAARRRTQRLIDDPDGAVGYGARRIFAFALMINGGMPIRDVPGYLLHRTWLQDAAAQLQQAPEDLAEELVLGMLGGGALVSENGRLHAAATSAVVDRDLLNVPWPREWT
jgi:hydroxyacylglutathione hydrolase